MEVLKFINEQLDNLEVPYEFGEWSTVPVQYPYFVGEIPSPEDIYTEDGFEEITFLITGFHRGKTIDLETYKEKIKKHFHSIYGLRAKTENGTIAVFYEGAFYVPTNESDLKKIQINLKIKHWEGEI